LAFDFGSSKSFVLISDQKRDRIEYPCPRFVPLTMKHSNPIFFFAHRINKKGSQKDAEQKKAGNYFFYDDEEVDDVDDDDL
jgi:hypothetical protein